MQEKRTILVWDLPVRVFHWSLVAMIALAFATSEAKGFLFKLHFAAGYAVIGLVAFRLAWGLAGTRHARFAAFVQAWPEVRRHALDVLRLKPARFIGHNPLGGWMIVALLATIGLLAATGLFAGDEGKSGPYAALAGPWLADALGELHEGLNAILWTLVAAHVAGVAGESLLTRENLVRAMWNGRKEAAYPADVAAGAGPVGALGLAVSLLVAVAVVGAIVLA